jgi:hypothetical protein
MAHFVIFKLDLKSGPKYLGQVARYSAFAVAEIGLGIVSNVTQSGLLKYFICLEK